MKRFKGFLALILALTTLLSFTACTDGESETETEAEASSESVENSESIGSIGSEIEKNDLINGNDLKDYKFVIGKEADPSILYAASGVSRIAKEKWKSDGAVNTDDYEKAENAPFEVLIGETNRPESGEYIASLKKGEGGYAVKGSKIVIAGYGKFETISALSLFFNNIMMPLNAAKKNYIDSGRNTTEYLADYVSVMSFNVYVGIEKDSAKASNALKIIKAYNPDILGVQEASSDWQVRLKSELKGEYEIYGENRGGSGGTEATKIYIRKDKFEVASFGTKWLSSTPDVASAVGGSSKRFSSLTARTEDCIFCTTLRRFLESEFSNISGMELSNARPSAVYSLPNISSTLVPILSPVHPKYA